MVSNYEERPIENIQQNADVEVSHSQAAYAMYALHHEDAPAILEERPQEP